MGTQSRQIEEAVSLYIDRTEDLNYKLWARIALSSNQVVGYFKKDTGN